MRVLRTVLGVAIATAACVLGLAVLAASLVLATPHGARAVLRAAGPLVPGVLDVRGVRGSLLTTLELRGVRYASDAVRAELETLIVEADWSALARGHPVLERLVLDGGALVIAPQLDADARTAGEPPPLPAIPADAAVRRLAITGVAVEGLGMPVDVRRIEGRLDGRTLELDRLELGAAGAVVDAAAAATIAPSGADGAVSGVLTLPAEPSAEPAELTLAATFELATAALPWHVALEWTSAAWRGAPPGAITSPGGRAIVTPGTEPMRIELATRIDAAVLPGGTAELDAAVTLAGAALEVERLTARTLGGEIRGRGGLELDALVGFASVAFEGLDPALLDARLTGVLGGELDVAAATAPQQVVAVAGNLRGRLGERPLDGRIEASYVAGDLRVARAEVTLDDGRVELAGELSRAQADLRLAASLPEIGHWYPPASGSVTADGTVTGDPSNPTVDFDLAAAGLALADSPLPPVAELTVAIEGVRDEHRVRLFARTDAGDVRLATRQSVDDGRVAGTLLETMLALPQAGTWRLVRPAPFRVVAADVTVENACLAGPERAQLCADVQNRRGRIVASGLSNALAAPWLPRGVAAAGELDAVIGLDWSGPFEASFELRQPTLTLTATPAGGEAEPAEAADGDAPPTSAEVRDLVLHGSVTEERLQADLTAMLAATGDPIRGAFTLSPPSAAGELQAELAARLTDLALVDTLVEGVDGLHGVLELSLEVAGTPRQPELRGGLVATSLSGALPPLGIEVTGGRLTAVASGPDDLTFEGRLCSDGCVRFDGRLERPAAAPWRLAGRLTGEGFELADLPDVTAVVSPQLTLDAGPDAWRVAGDLGIPTGAIEVQGVPRSGVRPAPETIVHGRPAAEDERRLALPLAVDVTATLGDVRFRGLGIEADLDGTLEIERTLDGTVRVQGTALIESGTFTAYAQTLTIERGLLIFTGLPENPALDIRATRMVEGALVGLNITGTARNPRSVVFSDPVLPESEAFARLLTGRSLQNAGAAADPEALEQAALGLGLRRALPTLNRLGANIGLDELSVEAAEGVEGGALVAGRRLGEDIVLRYRRGLFEDFSGLELIYQITDRFRLRTETGTAQSIDLIYEVGRSLGERIGGDPTDVVEEQAASPAEVVAPNLPQS